MNYTQGAAGFCGDVFARIHSDKLVISGWAFHIYIACSESHFELEWLLCAANYITVVHMFVCS